MSTVDDRAEQHSFGAGTHWSQQSELTSGDHSSGRQRTPGDHQGRHRRTDRILGRGEWAVVDLHEGYDRWWRTGDIEGLGFTERRVIPG